MNQKESQRGDGKNDVTCEIGITLKTIKSPTNHEKAFGIYPISNRKLPKGFKKKKTQLGLHFKKMILAAGGEQRREQLVARKPIRNLEGSLLSRPRLGW